MPNLFQNEVNKHACTHSLRSASQRMHLMWPICMPVSNTSMYIVKKCMCTDLSTEVGELNIEMLYLPPFRFIAGLFSLSKSPGRCKHGYPAEGCVLQGLAGIVEKLIQQPHFVVNCHRKGTKAIIF